MGDLSSLGNMFQTGMSNVGNFIQGIPGDVAGLFGGGSPVSPGTIGADASSIVNATPGVANVAGGAIDAGSLAGGGGQGVASMFGAGPSASIDPSLFSGAGVGASSLDPGAISSAFGIGGGGGGIPGISLDPTTGQLVEGGAGAASPGITMGSTSTGLADTAAQAGIPGAQAGGGNFLSKLFSNPNAMKMLGAGGMLGAEMLNANRQPPGLAAIQAMAQGQGQFAKNQGELALAEQQGLLPAGAQNMFQGQLNAAEAAIRSKYASMGMTGSTAEMQDLAAAREQVMGQMVQTGMQMAQSGWANVNQATGYESQLLNAAMTAQLQQQKDMQEALANFAGAFTDMGGPGGGGGTGRQLKVGPNGTLELA